MTFETAFLPLSSIQKHFLTNAAFFESSSAYHVSGLTRIQGALEIERLMVAWKRVFAVHVNLHGLAPTSGPAPSAPWEAVECPEDEVEAHALGVAEHPFDLERSLPVRVVLYRVSEALHFLLFVQHHAVTDLFSKNLLAAHLNRAYADSLFAPQVTPYSDFVRAETQYMASPAAQKAMSYWRGKMESGFETLRLPGQSLAPKPFAGNGGRLAWKPSPTLQSLLSSASGSERPVFLLLLSAYLIALSRLSGQTQFCVGVPLSNRLGFADQPLAGACVNLVPIVVTINASGTLREVYDQVRRSMLEAHRYQQIPFLEIAKMYTRGERDPLRPRLVQAGFTNEPPMDLGLEHTECSSMGLPRTCAQMDLFFTWWNSKLGVEGYWEYNSSSFGAGDVAVWQAAFDRILEAVLVSEESTVAGVSLTSPEQLNALTEGPLVEYPLDRGIDALLRQSYAQHSDQTAIVYLEREISYSEFASKVERMARVIAQFYGRGGRIAVLFQRGPDMLFALHAIVLSGNAYVPLGIDWPNSRIQDILSDLAPSLLIADEDQVHKVKLLSASHPLETVRELLARPEPEIASPAPEAAPGDPMYVLYTSGTTGRPKGAILPHRGIVNRLLWMQDAYPLVPGDRCLLKTPYTFDVSGWELFWPLLVGATLVVAPEHSHKDPREILDLIETQRIRIVHFVPSMLSHFLDQASQKRPSSLTDVVASGEALPPELVSRFFQVLPGVKLHNLYGPTEASIDVSSWTCTPADLTRGTIPIGRPIANTQIYVLDQALRPCPPLVRGELYLGGVGLASGYWNRPELTQQSFLSHPFGLGILYRTGDWGRYALDGAIEYLERVDNQVKIRGLRVELGEIETQLREVPRIANAVVKKGTSSLGTEILIAYYITSDGVEITTATITETLRSLLPGAIVPEAYVHLGDFPRSENGKIDRKALPDHVQAEARPLVPTTRDSTQARVSKLWCQLLPGRLEGSEDNFFDAGGNSIDLLSLRSLLEAEFGISVKIIDLFKNPTIEGMAGLFAPKTEVTPATGSSAGLRAQKQKEMMAKLARNQRQIQQRDER